MKKHFLFIACVPVFAISAVFADQNGEPVDGSGDSKECVQNEGNTKGEATIADASSESCSGGKSSP